MQQITSQINTTTVLEYAAVADVVTDKALMDACVSFMVETECRQESITKEIWASENATGCMSLKLVLCSVKVMEGPAMQRLMHSNIELAQKLLVDVMKQKTKKRKADEMA